MRDALILGGYGVFGRRIARSLTQTGIPITIAGRNALRADQVASQIRTNYPAASVGIAVMDIQHGLAAYLEQHKPKLVINTCGPFQNQNYTVAEMCLAHQIHYIDLADGRDFVANIASFDSRAKSAGICVISGASTVPTLSSAVIEHYRHEFSTIESINYGITPGQKTDRGLATTRAILSYVGKALKPVQGDTAPRYGWQDLQRQNYPDIGARWLANCDIPDLDLFPERYGIQRIAFKAGIENTLLHFGLWFLGWLVRLGAPLQLPLHAQPMLRISHMFDRFGSADGGMHMLLCGKDTAGKLYQRSWFIIAREGEGPQIPCIPSIILAKRLMSDAAIQPGAQPCIGLITLQDYLGELASCRNIRTYEY